MKVGNIQIVLVVKACVQSDYSVLAPCSSMGSHHPRMAGKSPDSFLSPSQNYACSTQMRQSCELISEESLLSTLHTIGGPPKCHLNPVTA